MTIKKLIKLEVSLKDIRGVVVWAEGLGSDNPLCITNTGDDFIIVTFKHWRTLEDLSESMIPYIDNTFKLSFLL